MINVFISQPMSGRSELAIRQERESVIKQLPKSYQILDSYFADQDPKGDNNIGLYLLGKSLEVMSEADLVIFIGDWEQSRGCKIEHECAIQYGIKTHYI